MRLLIGLLLLVTGCAAGPGGAGPRVAGPIGDAQGPSRGQMHWVPLRDTTGSTTLLLGRVCRPAGEQKARVVVIAHGSPPSASDRPGMQPTRCESETARWFLSRGMIVVSAMRRGYGGTGGAWVEGAVPCSVDAYERSARVSAEDVAATVAYALALPYARPDGAVVVGQSAGGWATLGLNAAPVPGVVAIVSMAGGRGGHVDNQPNKNCQPQNMVAAAGRLARTSVLPMLWVYTENDSYFAPWLARAMYEAYTGGGGRVTFEALPAFGRDGHSLFNGTGGSLIWGPLMERYFAQQGVT